MQEKLDKIEGYEYIRLKKIFLKYTPIITFFSIPLLSFYYIFFPIKGRISFFAREIMGLIVKERGDHLFKVMYPLLCNLIFWGSISLFIKKIKSSIERNLLKASIYLEFKTNAIVIDENFVNLFEIENYHIAPFTNKKFMLKLVVNNIKSIVYLDNKYKQSVEQYFKTKKILMKKHFFDEYYKAWYVLYCFVPLLFVIVAVLTLENYLYIWYRYINN